MPLGVVTVATPELCPSDAIFALWAPQRETVEPVELSQMATDDEDDDDDG